MSYERFKQKISAAFQPPRIHRKLAVNVRPFPGIQVLLVARRETRFSPAMRIRITSILKVRKKLFELSPSVRFRTIPF